MNIQNSIFLFDGFYSDVSERIVKQLIELSATAREIDIYINSPGGHTSDLFAIIDTITQLRKNNGIKINTIGLGEASSCGSYLLMYGDTREVGANTEIFTHGVQSITGFSETEIRKHLERVTKMNDTLAKYMSDNSKLTPEEARAYLEGDKYITPQEALDIGIIDSIWSGTDELEEEIMQYGMAAAKDFEISENVIVAQKFIKSLKNKSSKEGEMPTEKEFTAVKSELDTAKSELTTLKSDLTAKDAEITAQKKITDDLQVKYDELEASIETASMARKDKTIASCEKLVAEESKEVFKTTLNSVKATMAEVEFTAFAESLMIAYKKKDPSDFIQTEKKPNPEKKAEKKEGDISEETQKELEEMEANINAGKDFYDNLDLAKKR